VPASAEDSRAKRVRRAIARFIAKYFVNPLARRAADRGLAKSVAVLETTGRKSGLPRRVPVGNGLRGSHFWIVTEHGRGADYVKNIEQNPRVRVKAEGHWYEGTAHLLPDDDVAARFRMLKRPMNDAVVRLVGTEKLTIRVDLDEAGQTAPARRASR
jgi:deazaflavin-dependent oxidoreductase (nitroreductase family)